MLLHLRFQFVNFLLHRLWRKRQVIGIILCRRARGRFTLAAGFHHVFAQLKNIRDLFIQPLRHNAVLSVVALLLLTAALSLFNCARHRGRDLISIKNRFTVHVTCSTANRLNQ